MNTIEFDAQWGVIRARALQTEMIEREWRAYYKWCMREDKMRADKMKKEKKKKRLDDIDWIYFRRDGYETAEDKKKREDEEWLEFCLDGRM